MALNVLDIGSYQSTLDLNLVHLDGVMIKATEGTSYVNPACDKHYQEAKKLGKKRGIYHFFNFGLDPIAQADFFVNNCKGYIRDAIFVLDWEGSGVANVSAALAFLKRVEAQIGYKPAIYMSEWVENNYNWAPVVSNNNGLWIAKYSNWELANHAHDWDMSQAGQHPTVKHWPFYFMWQWTSTGLLKGYAGNLDCDIAYLTGQQWDAYAGVKPPAPAPASTTTQKPAPPPEPAPTTTVKPPAPTPTPEPEPTTTTTQKPAPEPAPSPNPDDSTTTTTTQAPSQNQPAQGRDWVAVAIMAIASFVVAIFNRLRGEQNG